MADEKEIDEKKEKTDAEKRKEEEKKRKEEEKKRWAHYRQHWFLAAIEPLYKLVGFLIGKLPEKWKFFGAVAITLIAAVGALAIPIAGIAIAFFLAIMAGAALYQYNKESKNYNAKKEEGKGTNENITIANQELKDQKLQPKKVTISSKDKNELQEKEKPYALLVPADTAIVVPVSTQDKASVTQKLLGSKNWEQRPNESNKLVCKSNDNITFDTSTNSFSLSKFTEENIKSLLENREGATLDLTNLSEETKNKIHETKNKLQSNVSLQNGENILKTSVKKPEPPSTQTKTPSPEP